MLNAQMSAAVPLNGHTFPLGVITYTGAHRRIYSHRGPASHRECDLCGGPARQWSYMGGAPDEQVDPDGRPYSGDPNMYRPLCVPCHKRSDLATGGFAPAPCGTEKGYNRHRGNGTPRCAPCKRAHADYEASRVAARADRRSGFQSG